MNLETLRMKRISEFDQEHKKRFGQFITPLSIAQFMANLIPTKSFNDYKILDPGAGIGTLSYTLLNKILAENTCKNVELDCYEIDKTIIPILKKTFTVNQLPENENIKINIFETDFILDTVFKISFKINPLYNCIILNPPYKKIRTESETRSILSSIGIETVNLYTAFIAVSILLLSEGGYISAIIPRSFCNGLYYLPFRNFLDTNIKIRRIHLFNSRKSSFKDESVLQENIIVLLQKSNNISNVIISKSEDGEFKDYSEYSCAYDKIINPEDSQKYINIPDEETHNINNAYNFNQTLSDLDLSVSTGPIVDFRNKEYLKQDYKPDCVPLIYPQHLKDNKLNWPVKSKKPNAIIVGTNEIKKSLFPKGNYIVIRRFTAKEEKKRIVASIITKEDFISEFMTFENHLNVIHQSHAGIDIFLAYGLLVYLNSDYFDNCFRLFSGHTQVNCTDLRNMNFPSKEILQKIGKRIKDLEIKNIDFEDVIAEVINNAVKDK